MSLTCILALLLPVLIVAETKTFTVDPGSGNKVVYNETYRTANLQTPLSIKSNVPVSLIKFADSSLEGGWNIIESEEIRVYLKSDCEEIMDLGVKVEGLKSKETYGLEELMIRSANVTSNGHLEGSEFHVEWDMQHMICPETGELPPEHPPQIATGTGGAMMAIPIDSEGNERKLETTGLCNITAEVIYDGCQNEIDINAPSVKVIDAGLSLEKSTPLHCATGYEGKLSLSQTLFEVPSDGSGIVHVKVEKLGRGDGRCMKIAMGRPFIDADKKQVQAEAVTNRDACWSKSEIASFEENKTPDRKASSLASSWIERSIGEHASIASFAAFTISLMTNNAPPDLIRDALLAALDELDHATTSFEMASLLSGETIEPGPLPSSNHDFGYDVGALMVSTFKEGCVDETLSALAAAAEAESYSLCEVDDENDCVMEKLLEEKLSKIALDEARHSALAWRTIEWACGVDEVSCDDLLKNHKLDESGLLDTAKLSFPSLHGAFDLEWRKIHEVLFDFVTGSKKDVAYDCESDGDVTGLSNRERSIVKEVSKMVIGEVMCGFGRMESSEDVVLASS